MKINSLELKNIRSYTQGRVEFPTGTVLLSGDVGHGKSSLLMGIEFCLFGLRGGQLSGEDLLREGTEKGSVKLDFSVEDNEYQVKRNLKRKGDSVRQKSGYLIKNGVKKELSPRELKAHIFKILGYPMEMLSKRKSLIYRYTVYTPQEKMKEILEANAEERMNTLRKVLGINKYKKIRENITTVRRKSKNYQKELQGRYSDLGDKKEKKKDLEKKLEELRKKKQERQKKVEKEEEKKKEIEEKVEKFHEFDKKKTNLESDLENSKKMLEDKKQEKKDKKQEITEIKQLEKPTEKEIPEIQKEIKELEERKEKYLKNKRGLDEKTDSLLEKKEKLEEDEKKTEKKISNKKAEKKTLEESTKELKKAGTECPVCGHELTEQHRKQEVERKKEQMKKLEKDIKELQEKKKEQESRKKDLKQKIEERTGEKVEGINEKTKKKRELKEKLKEYKEKKKKKKELRKEVEEKQEKISELEKKIKKTSNRLEEVQKNLKELQDVKKKEEKIEKRLEKARNKLGETKEKISSKKTEIKSVSENKEELEKEIKKKEEAKKLDKKIEDRKNWIEGLGELSETIEEQFMINLQKRFNDLFNEWFNVLVENDELDVRVDEKFSPIIEREGYKSNYDRLSGGERTSVALAYRLALNEVVNFLVEKIKTKDLIILDEPTDGFSTNQLDKVRDIIQDLDISQMIMVSHEQKVESYVDNVINVRKEAGESVIEY